MLAYFAMRRRHASYYDRNSQPHHWQRRAAPLTDTGAGAQHAALQ